MYKYSLYRGTPYSGLDLEELEGRGGYGHQMVGPGLYLTDDYYVAKAYAQPESPRYRDSIKDSRPCVYELELEIPEEEILYVGGMSLDMRMCDVEGTSSIPFIFGVKSPAFELKLKDLKSGEIFTYLISETEDPLEYAQDFKMECANEVIGWLGLGRMSEYTVFEEYVDDYMSEESQEVFLEYVKQANGDEARVVQNVQERIDSLIRENSGLSSYGLYGEAKNILWGGDSTDLTGIASDHGYKVLWCSDWLSSGDEVVIVDDSIYGNGLSIVDDCTD